MKKFLYPALALSALALASCSSEEPVAGNGDSVTFNVTIPGSLSSRATLGDQILAPVDNLQWTVYEVNGETKTAVYTASFEGTPFAGGKTTETVTLNLGKGKTYQVVFYADNAANGAVSFTNGVLSVDYDAMATNTLAEDAFVGTSEAVVAGDPTNTVQLIRPFAQLNWGTSDLNDPVVAKYINPADGVTALTAQVTVTGTLYKSFDVISNTFSDEVTDATFGAVTAADFSAYETDGQKVTFPAVGGTETYSLLAMNYLMPGTQGTATCTLAFNNGFESVEVNSVTLKQNFRTNIYGALLTNPTEFNVQIAPAFEEGDENVEYPEKIKTPEQFIAALTEGGNIEVGGDLDLTGEGDLNIDQPTVLSVNGTLKVNNSQLKVNSELTLKEGTVASPGFAIIGTDNSKIVIDGGTVTTDASYQISPYATAQAINTSGSFEMTGGRVESTAKVAVTMNWANGTAARTMEISGGEIVGGNDYALNIYGGNSSSNNVATISGGTFVGNSGARADGNVNLTITGGYFIQESTNSTGHAFCAGAESYGSAKCKVTIDGGYFYGSPGYAICRANSATLVVNKAYMNKLGGGYTLGNGCTAETLATPVTATVNGKTYSFGYEVK